MGNILEVYKGFDISGKNCLITGAGGKIGSTLSIKLAESGVNIVAFDINTAEMERASEKISNTKSDYIFYKADLTSSTEVEEKIEKVVKRWKKIDILINCIGTFGSGKYAKDLNEAEWDKDLDINLKSVFLCCHEIGKQMIKQQYGKIINFSSQAGYNYIKGTPKSTYCVSKASIIMLTKVLAYEWAEYNVNVNAIAPGFIDTEDNPKNVERQGIEFSKLEIERIQKTPLRRLGNINDLFGAIVFLASDFSNFIT
ncbi:MAG: SDR family NAD(P)-dependent oxidoreductase, partial [Actinomycetota bacterium]